MTDAVRFNPVLLLPTYNNAPVLGAVLAGVAALGRPMLVVDDGSTDGTAGVLDEFVAAHPDATLHRLPHPRNRGKGAALRTGFADAAARGYTHALSIDTDGQHDPADADKLLAAAAADPTAFVTGYRDVRDPEYPAKSRWGRLWSNLCILLASGQRVEDSQCGYRVYPLGLVEAVRCRAGRYGYEAEMLTRAGWAGCALVQVPVRVIYPSGDQRISHFRPVVDSLRGAALHLRLMTRALMPWPHAKWPPPKAGRDKAQAVASLEHAPPWWRRLLRWIDPRGLVRDARRDRVSQMSVAAGLGLGVFVANLPVYPVQTLVAVYLAKRLHLHPVSTVAGSQASFPPVGLLLSFAAICLGHLLLTGRPASWADFSGLGSLSFAEVRTLMHEYFLSWWIGGFALGTVLGLTTTAVATFALRYLPVEHETVLDDDSPSPDHHGPGINASSAAPPASSGAG
ncbi:MAG: DUF2062 domain-containing protein [Planctomycetota bacterium]